MLVNVPSSRDPTMRVPGDGGSHLDLLSVEVLGTPYDLRGGWKGSPEPERWLEGYSSLVQPGFMDQVVRWRAMTPPDYEADLGLPRGHAAAYGGSPLAVLRRRDELTHYETRIDGLYLTGAGTYPGSGIWGASGRNAAQVILERHA
jgi:phytoene dehydrogenase-like protein